MRLELKQRGGYEASVYRRYGVAEGFTRIHAEEAMIVSGLAQNEGEAVAAWEELVRQAVSPKVAIMPMMPMAICFLMRVRMFFEVNDLFRFWILLSTYYISSIIYFLLFLFVAKIGSSVYY